MADDVLLNKMASIERCLVRVREEYCGHESLLETDHTRQDSIILNLQRACEAAIDLAMHVSRKHRLGLPQDARDGFTLLEKPISSQSTSPAGCVPWWVSATSRSINTSNSASRCCAPSSTTISATLPHSPPS